MAPRCWYDARLFPTHRKFPGAYGGLCFAVEVDTFTAPGAPRGADMLERLFQLKAHNTNVRTE
ncbi:hypothetical protein AB4142_35985, partial [Variovorax sp. 2RAF20]